MNIQQILKDHTTDFLTAYLEKLNRKKAVVVQVKPNVGEDVNVLQLVKVGRVIHIQQQTSFAEFLISVAKSGGPQAKMLIGIAVMQAGGKDAIKAIIDEEITRHFHRYLTPPTGPVSLYFSLSPYLRITMHDAQGKQVKEIDPEDFAAILSAAATDATEEE